MVTWITEHLGFVCMHDRVPEDASYVSALGIKDGYDDPEKIYEIVKYIVELLSRHRKVVVMCHAGLSRSPSMGITALAFLRQQTFEDTYYQIKKSTAPQADPSPGLGRACQEALNLLNKRDTKLRDTYGDMDNRI